MAYRPPQRRAGGRGRTWLAATVMLAFAAALAATGCSSSASNGSATTQTAEPAQQASFPVEITDDASRTVTVAKEPLRIVSLAPANTEILTALGLGNRLVGVTTYDDYPPSVKDLPKMGDFVNPNIEAIGAAQPDLIVATTGVQADVLKKLESLGAVVLAVDPTTLEGLYTDIGRIGDATGTKVNAEDLVKTMRSQIGAISSAVAKEEPLSVFVEIGQNPLYTVGSSTLIDEMLRAAGGVNVVSAPGYVAYSLEQLVKDDPDAYMATMGTMSDPSDLGKRAGYDKLRAVVNKRVYLLQDNLVTRPGPRIVEGVRMMAADLHPDVFSK